MKPSTTARLAAMAALAAAGLAAPLLALVSLNAGGSVRLGPLEAMPLAEGYQRRNFADLSAGASSPQVRRDAAARARAAIAQAPYAVRAWLALAQLDGLEHGRLTPAGVAALQRSYDLVAVEPQVALWRIRFSLEHAQALPKPLLAQVRTEAAALWTHGGRRAKLRAMRTELANPRGRLILFLWVHRFETMGAE